MFEIEIGENGEIRLSGRLDASQADRAGAVLDKVQGGAVVDLRNLEYVSSMGLGILLKTQKRLRAAGNGELRLVKPNRHIRDVFRFSGFDHIFEIEDGD